ncbi:MAG: EF2563 family selenium-dependent molybdenum hydroxylase system protein [Chloroflexi bacterium]|nr:EF2563 family selenium-dependent molybdenum hydroxylase system protein [Chloroflexota bacterium]
MASVLFEHLPVVVRGGGDLASGVVYRLAKSGFPVTVMELAHPLAIRRAVAFASAVFEGQITIEGLLARHIDTPEQAWPVLQAGDIPVLVDPDGASIDALQPVVVVDARIAKRNLGTTRDDASLVIACGPGFEAGKDCHAVIETNRGHYLGRVIWHGTAEPDTGLPGGVRGRVADRVLRAPAAGAVQAAVEIGAVLHHGDLIATVDTIPLTAPFDGVLRGLLHPDVPVQPGMKIGDIDPRGKPEYCFSISEKSLAIGGGVLEAIFSAPHIHSSGRVGRAP